MATLSLEIPQFLDTTLRDGEQAPGVSFSLDEKLSVAQGLDALGVDIIEAGVPAMGGAEMTLFKELADRKLRAEVLAWNRLVRSDIEASLCAGATSVHVSVPCSEVHLARKLRKTRDGVLRDLDTILVDLGRERVKFSVGAEDASRADGPFVAQVFELAQSRGASRLRYADTLGVLDPEATTARIRSLARKFSTPIDFHGHNDFGLATANALAAWKAGARVLSCTLLGLGERAGNASLEEVAAAVQFVNRRPLGWDFSALKRLCEQVALASGRPIPAGKPLFGEAVFTHESGIHVDGLLKDATTYEAWQPEELGGQRRLVLGKHSGTTGVVALAHEWGLIITPTQATEFLRVLRDTLEVDKKTSPRRLLEAYLAGQESAT